jgi:phosphoglycerate dehydrogenase-like enzyme
MFRIWFERELPDHVTLDLSDIAVILGPGTATPEDLTSAISGAEAAIASSLLTYDAGVMDRAPGLRVIARTGIGYDKVDVDAATARGIAVCNAPDAPTTSTAEHAVALMLAVAKRLERIQAALRSGGRDFFAVHEAIEIADRQLGIVGAGRIGRSVARLGRGLGMETVAYDPFVQRSADDDLDFVDSLGDLFSRADVVSLHVPLTDATRHLVDAGALAAMKPGSILINTARGGLVDNDALLAALEDGRLFGAGLDVTDPEPLPPGHPLLHRDDVVVTPHIATATTAGKARLYDSAVSQALQVLRHECPPHLVNPHVWPVRRPGPYSEES